LKHLAVRNPDLPHPDHTRGRIGAWNTVILTACGLLTQPDKARDVTCRLDMVTCPRCMLWALSNRDKLEDDDQGHLVTA
jgi:hypothetical protein